MVLIKLTYSIRSRQAASVLEITIIAVEKTFLTQQSKPVSSCFLRKRLSLRDTYHEGKLKLKKFRLGGNSDIFHRKSLFILEQGKTNWATELYDIGLLALFYRVFVIITSKQFCSFWV